MEEGLEMMVLVLVVLRQAVAEDLPAGYPAGLVRPVFRSRADQD